jgi:predicted nucleic acid-binding protein
VLDALRIQERWQLSYRDAQILSSAMRTGASVLFTEDLQDMATIESIMIQNPFKTME